MIKLGHSPQSIVHIPVQVLAHAGWNILRTNAQTTFSAVSNSANINICFKILPVVYIFIGHCFLPLSFWVPQNMRKRQNVNDKSKSCAMKVVEKNRCTFSRRQLSSLKTLESWLSVASFILSTAKIRVATSLRVWWVAIAPKINNKLNKENVSDNKLASTTNLSNL